MDEFKIQNIVANYARSFNHTLVTPNTRMLFPWEADLVSVTPAGRVHEYEIKISKSDFKADARKKKHYTLKFPGNATTPNYFWYVCHGFDVEPNDVPSYAGLIKLPGDPCRLFVKKKPPALHRAHLTIREREYLQRALSHRLWNLRQNVATGEHQRHKGA